jgi:hypothetical protein
LIEVEALGKRMSLSRRGWDVVMFSRGAEFIRCIGFEGGVKFCVGWC